MSKQTAFITGAAGFLGTFLAEACAADGIAIVGIDRNPPREPQLFNDFHICDCATADYDTILLSNNFAFVFHLAGSASVPFSVQSPEQDFASLLPATARLLSAVGRLEGKKPKLLLMSSAAVYGNPVRLPIKETDRSVPLSPYGIHKLMAESMVEHYGRIYNFSSASMRVFSAYGPGLRKQLLWDVCCRMLTAAADGKESIEIHGTGNETRDFIHARDVAIAAILIAKSNTESHECYNLASGIESTVEAICHQLSEALGRPCHHSFNQVVRTGDPVFWRSDLEKLRALGFHPSISLATGIEETAHWVRSVAGSAGKIASA